MTIAHGRPILVTGAHRTGTTWVGRLLAADPSIAYISEPLNVLHHPGIMPAHIQHWYTYISPDNEGQYLRSYLELIAYRYHSFAGFASMRTGRDALRIARDLGIFLRGRLFRQRPLWKDPFAVFSVGWFARRFDCEIVVTVRHPAAFVSSLKRLNWSFDFRDLLQQPYLMRDHLERYRSSMQSDETADVVGQASLLWTMIYQSLHAMHGTIPSMIVIRHEDLSLDPTEGFRRLYNQLGLDFSRHVEQLVLRSSSSENPAELTPKRMHSVKLDSQANLGNWKRRLTPDEITRVRHLTGETARLYYPELEWN